MPSERSERFQRVDAGQSRSLSDQLLLSFVVSGLATAYQAFLLFNIVGVWANLYSWASGGEAILSQDARYLIALAGSLEKTPLQLLIILAVLWGSFILIMRFTALRVETLLLVIALLLLVETILIAEVMSRPLFNVVYLIK